MWRFSTRWGTLVLVRAEAGMKLPVCLLDTVAIHNKACKRCNTRSAGNRKHIPPCMHRADHPGNNGESPRYQHKTQKNHLRCAVLTVVAHFGSVSVSGEPILLNGRVA